VVVDSAKSLLFADIVPEELPRELGGSAYLAWNASVDAWMAEEDEEEENEEEDEEEEGLTTRT
jgi:hypothetical protein